MLKFKYVRYKNLLSTGNNFTEIQIDRNPTTLFVGENGAGKSTILDALCFGLFGRPYRTITKSQLVNSINESGTVVEIELETNGKYVKIVRGMKPNKFEVYIDNTLMNQDAAAKDYQEQLEQHILKLNYRSFTQVVILGTSTFVPFMQLSSKVRREVVEDILDIKIFSLMNVILKTKAKELLENTTALENKMVITQKEIDLHKKYIKDLSENKESIIKSNNDQISENNKTIDSKTKELNTFKEEYDKENKNIDSVAYEESTKKVTKINSTSGKLENKKSHFDNQIDWWKDHDDCPTCEQVITDEFKQKKINDFNTKIKELDKALEELSDMEKTEKGKLSAWNKCKTKLDGIKVETAKLTTSLNELKKFNSKLESDNTKYSNKDISDEDVKKLGSLEGELKTLEELKQKYNVDKFYIDVAKNLLQDSGIKTKIVKQYLPIMNKLINTYLTSMDFFVNFNIDENFNETIKSRFRDVFSYANFSEGEKMRIDLALLFTWRAVAKMKNSVSTNLLILDEIFDSSLDANGTDEFLKILNTFQDENIFVISHKQDILYDKFRSVVHFKKERNFSHVVT